MAKDPAFLFYSDNFLSGTMFMTDEQVGKFIRLLCAQHQTGHLTEKHMMFICKSYDLDIWSKFEKDSAGNYFNKRLDSEIEKRKKYSESRSKNRKTSDFQNNNPLKEQKDMSNISSTYDNHMGNGNGNGNINENGKGNKKRVQGEKSETIINTHPFPPEFYPQWERWLNYKRDEFSDRYKTISSQQTAFNRLVSLSGSDQIKAIEIIDYSIAQHWKGLFNHEQQNGKQPINRKERARQELNAVAEAHRNGIVVDFSAYDNPVGGTGMGGQSKPDHQ